MSALTTIPGIGKASHELLEAAGFHDVEALARAGVDQLTGELVRANGILGIAKRPPARKNVEKWIRAARQIIGETEEAPVAVPAMPVNFEAVPSVATMLANAPLAVPLPGRHLIARGLAVSDIPPGILLNRYSGDLEVRVEDRIPGQRNVRQPQTGYVRMAENNMPPRTEIDHSRLRTMEEAAKKTQRVPGAASSSPDDRVALIRAPRESTNMGKDPSSRRYVRGVLHGHPYSIRFGALATLALMICLPLALVSAGLLLLSDQSPERFAWVPRWLLVFPAVLPIFGIGWLMLGMRGSCRICGQKLFVPKNCRKNAKAHHLPGLGYILPLCLHILFFHWFRCTHCGTPVRLKK
jgi:hypothetical protein